MRWSMAHLKKDDINFDKLETGVQKAMEADNLYWLQNEAKFRAVKQKGSYDEFKWVCHNREMVYENE